MEEINRIGLIHTPKGEVGGFQHVGLLGEVRVCRILEKARGTITYWQLAGVYRGRNFEFDHLIITASGVLLLEEKSYTGEIHPDPDGDDWYWHKPSKAKHNGNPKMRNPVAQVKRNAGILQRMLKDWGINLPVIPVVVLTMNCELLGFGEFDVPVLRLHNLRHFIQTGLPAGKQPREALRLAAHIAAAGATPSMFDQAMVKRTPQGEKENTHATLQ